MTRLQYYIVPKMVTNCLRFEASVGQNCLDKFFYYIALLLLGGFGQNTLKCIQDTLLCCTQFQPNVEKIIAVFVISKINLNKLNKDQSGYLMIFQGRLFIDTHLQFSKSS